MVQSYTQQVKQILLEHGCSFVHPGKGDHAIWRSPISGAHFVVDGNIPSRHLANTVLKQAGVKRKID